MHPITAKNLAASRKWLTSGLLNQGIHLNEAEESSREFERRMRCENPLASNDWIAQRLYCESIRYEDI